MNNFAIGLVTAWGLIMFYPKFGVVIGFVAVTLAVFCTGWDLAKYALKKGWTKP